MKCLVRTVVFGMHQLNALLQEDTVTNVGRCTIFQGCVVAQGGRGWQNKQINTLDDSDSDTEVMFIGN